MKKQIGIVGGMGPHASLDLFSKILSQIHSNTDQDYLPVALLSTPHTIEDRTNFLLGLSNINPGYAIADVIRKLELIGSNIIGIPCNTSHAPEIFNTITKCLTENRSKVKIVHIINEVAKYILVNYPHIKNIGILCTMGSYKAKVYENIFCQKDLNIITPELICQEEKIHKSIYDIRFGIKAKPNMISFEAKKRLYECIAILQDKGAEIIVIGCTEISLAIRKQKIGGTCILDSNMILAKALLREAEENSEIEDIITL
jgi:aspartate racemase